jgi:hypothetical protein
MKKIIIFTLLSFITACSSEQKSELKTSETEPDKVIARIDDLKERPSWVKESEPFRIEGAHIISLGQTIIPGDNRVEAAYRIAENNGKAAIASAIESRLDTVFQNAEEGTDMSTQARYIGAEATKLTTNSLRLDKRYWEKIATTDDSGQRKTIYKVFATVKMPESDFKKAVLDAIRKQQGKGGLSEDFSKKVNDHWDKFVSENKYNP